MPEINRNSQPVGLRKPWVWMQPKDQAELVQRLLEAREYAVHERERENLCSMAYEALMIANTTIANLHAEIDRVRAERQAGPDGDGWISFRKAVPALHQHCLLWSASDDATVSTQGTANQDRDGKIYFAMANSNQRRDVREFTHWMPTPSSPFATDRSEA